MSEELTVLYRDDSIICCVKEPGTVSEEPGMPSLIRRSLGLPEVYCVHRLDRDTGGVMAFALNRNSAASLSRSFSSGGSACKRYLTVISGAMEEKSGTLNDLLFHDSRKNHSYIVDRVRKGVREASLQYETLAECGGMSLISVLLHSGRTHQIRVQFSGRQHPVAGDRRYGSDMDCPLALWASILSFDHPVTGERIDVCSSPPNRFPWDQFTDQIQSGMPLRP